MAIRLLEFKVNPSETGEGGEVSGVIERDVLNAEDNSPDGVKQVGQTFTFAQFKAAYLAANGVALPNNYTERIRKALLRAHKDYPGGGAGNLP